MFGPRIIGKEAFEAQKEAEKKGADIYGEKVTSAFVHRPRARPLPVDPSARPQTAPPTDLPPAPPAPPTGEDDADLREGELSEAEVKGLLVSQPELYERLVALELQRQPNPRKGVSRLLLAFETGEQGQKRADVVARLQAAIEG